MHIHYLLEITDGVAMALQPPVSFFFHAVHVLLYACTKKNLEHIHLQGRNTCSHRIVRCSLVLCWYQYQLRETTACSH